MNNINDNLISNRWKARYMTLSDDIKQKIDALNREDWTPEKQLRIIKKKKQYPQIGDIFKINPLDEFFLYGIVINNHINNINGEDLLLILIFKEGVDIKESVRNGVNCDDILIPPQIVGKEYWTRGYFYNIEHYVGKISASNYGFYRLIDKDFLDEYGNRIEKEPELLGLFSVVTTVGIARKIRRELIIEGIL